MKESGGLGVLFPNDIRRILRSLGAATQVDPREVQLVANAMGFSLTGFEDSPLHKSEVVDRLNGIEETGAINPKFLGCVRRGLGIPSPSAEHAKSSNKSPWTVLDPPLLKSPSR